MKDLPYDNHNRYAGYAIYDTGSLKISSKEKIHYSVLLPYESEDKVVPNIRLWNFFHLHIEEGEINIHHFIEDSICVKCRKKFPSFQNLVTAVLLKRFKKPQNVPQYDRPTT
jgi:hypothetical protein